MKEKSLGDVEHHGSLNRKEICKNKKQNTHPNREKAYRYVPVLKFLWYPDQTAGDLSDRNRNV